MSDAPGAPARGPAVFTIPAHRSFADALVAGLRARYGTGPMDLARGRILLPNNRAVRAITEAFVRASGGGLVKAQSMIDSDPFLAINSDNLWVDGPADTLKLLASHWDGRRMDALLLLVPHARAMNHKGLGDFHVDRSGKLRRRGRSRVAPFVYTGIQMVSKALLKEAPEGAFSTNLLWDRAIAAGRCYGAVHQGLWFDVGNPQSIRATEQVLANV